MPCGEVGPRPDLTRSADVDEPGGMAIRLGDHRLWPVASYRVRSSTRRCTEENGGLAPRPQSISVRDGRRTPSSAAVSLWSPAIDGLTCLSVGSTCHVPDCSRFSRALSPPRADLGWGRVLCSRVLPLPAQVRASLGPDVPRSGTGGSWDTWAAEAATRAVGAHCCARLLRGPTVAAPNRTGPARPSADLSARWCDC